MGEISSTGLFLQMKLPFIEHADMKRRFYLQGFVLSAFFLLAYPGLSFASSKGNPDHWVAQVSGAQYLCKTQREAKQQDINPSYLVPGCIYDYHPLHRK